MKRSEAEQGSWSGLFDLREQVLPDLEKARQSKLIGKSLEAKVILTGSTPLLMDGKIHLEALRELLNVSQLEMLLEGGPSITVAKAEGRKCERCWHWEIDVGGQTEHPTICGRCIQAVTQS